MWLEVVKSIQLYAQCLHEELFQNSISKPRSTKKCDVRSQGLHRNNVDHTEHMEEVNQYVEGLDVCSFRDLTKFFAVLG